MEHSFGPILVVADIMHTFGHPWFVCGGWAIDLFLGTVTREHSDIEVGIYRRDQQALRDFLPEWTLEKAITTAGGGKWIPWERGEELRLPMHQIKASSARLDCREFEFFLNERTETDWTSRRHLGLFRPLHEIAIRSSPGIPILAPEIQLLFKAKQTRAKDEADFDRCLDRLGPGRLAWLKDALARYHPDHQWLKRL